MGREDQVSGREGDRVMDVVHSAKLVAQAAGRALPDLRYLERHHRSVGQDYLADQVKVRIILIEQALADFNGAVYEPARQSA